MNTDKHGFLETEPAPLPQNNRSLISELSPVVKRASSSVFIRVHPWLSIGTFRDVQYSAPGEICVSFIPKSRNVINPKYIVAMMNRRAGVTS